MQIALSHRYRPTVNHLGDLSQPTTVYDAAGNQIGKVGILDREPPSHRDRSVERVTDSSHPAVPEDRATRSPRILATVQRG